jgi:hypothetical protein
VIAINTRIAEPPADNSGSERTNPELTGLLLCRDLKFTTKIMAKAAALGYRLRATSHQEAARSLFERVRPQVVFVDLSAGEMVAPDALGDYRKLAGPGVAFVAFGPVVDAAASVAAEAIGCRAILSRSKFTADLPRLMRRYLQG